MSGADLASRPGVDVAARVGPFPMDLHADLVRRFAGATVDPDPDVRSGTVVPPVLAVTKIWDAQEAGRAAAFDRQVFAAARGGVHGEHDLVVHRPLAPGERLQTYVSGRAARPVGGNAVLTMRYESVDATGAVVVEQLWTTVLLGTTCAPVGDDLPDHRFAEDARSRPVATHTITVDADMPRRYAEVSGDWSAHHFDAAAARQSGADRPFLHGVCTLALCARAVTAEVGGGDPRRLRRLAVRFATPVPVGEDVTVDVYDAGDGAYAFEATAAGALVITHGRAEVGDPNSAG
ncbi:MAG TPA: MaoC/PaaZ C-terminal domain-containing protein [Mycobacteriales bacterium]|nr:MaoC/PaaZ C-terminal domain-containing protein [Mycobacteriales bacterium]